ncbi:hypothetical protein H5410_023278 [Solanum commersonii]|uniref:Uncharacterized protein n=1 Tax=Solanum commersonii TaxID=4109 RepID=A0A9J5ZHU3_SOLCO|nr:hypothetical protein H5410_023278 [Solanum commersonii]
MDQEDIKSTRLEEVDIPQNLDLLNKWTIPKVNIKTIYDYGWFDKFSNKQLIKTTEQSLALNSSEQTIHALTLNVKMHGYNYAAGSELICLSYRIYYKVFATLNPRCKLYDTSDQTILVETNFARSKVTTRRPIKWEEINFPTTWILDSVIPPKQLTDAITNSEYSHISQNSDGKICMHVKDKEFKALIELREVKREAQEKHNEFLRKQEEDKYALESVTRELESLRSDLGELNLWIGDKRSGMCFED